MLFSAKLLQLTLFTKTDVPNKIKDFLSNTKWQSKDFAKFKVHLHILFTCAVSAIHCIFKELTLVWSISISSLKIHLNAENARRKRDVATQLQSSLQYIARYFLRIFFFLLSHLRLVKQIFHSTKECTAMLQSQIP